MSLLTKVGHALYVNRSKIFFGVGLTTGVAAVVVAAVETVKACDIIENANYKLDDIENNKDLTDEEKKTESKKIRKETNLKIAKTYAIPVVLEATSIATLLASFKILSDEKAAAVAAWSAAVAGWEKYRSGVIDRFGEEVDYEIYNGIKDEVKQDENGNDIVVRTKDPIDNNCYTKIFSYETSSEWKRTRRLNIAILQHYEREFNRQLIDKGYITYNEVIEALGFSRKVGEGMTETFIPNGIGWVSAENVPDGLEGQFDTFIKFAPQDDAEADELDTLYDYGDLGYVLRFNCYPIDGLLFRKSEAIAKGEH